MTIKPKAITQHCLKNHFFDEVIKLSPERVRIKNIFFEAGFAIKRLSQPIPSSLRRCGVSAIRKSDPSVEVEGTLTGSRESMSANVSAICASLGLKKNTVRVKRMVVIVGKHEGTFHRMQKLLPGDDDKIARRTVLGLVKWSGSETAIANACNTNTFQCTYTTQVIRTVLCEEK